MTPERIKEIHSLTAYPESISVRQALLQVWNECEQDNKELREQVRKLREGLEEVLKEYEYSCKLMAEANGMENEPQFLQTWDMNNCKHSESGVPVHKDFEHIRKYCQFYEGR